MSEIECRFNLSCILTDVFAFVNPKMADDGKIFALYHWKAKRKVWDVSVRAFVSYCECPESML